MLEDLLDAQATADTAWRDAWGHWFALYDTLASYALQLLRATWRLHLPPLLALLPALRAKPVVALPLESTDDASSWAGVLFEIAMQHSNPAIQRFVALRLLGALQQECLLLPMPWLTSRLAPVLVQSPVMGAALALIQEVCFLFLHIRAIVLCERSLPLGSATRHKLDCQCRCVEWSSLVGAVRLQRSSAPSRCRFSANWSRQYRWTTQHGEQFRIAQQSQ